VHAPEGQRKGKTPICYACLLSKGKQLFQTKEHYFTGECTVTREAQEEATTERRILLEKWGVESKGIEKIQQLIKQEYLKVPRPNLEKDINLHSKGIHAIGLWRGKIVSQVALAIEEGTQYNYKVNAQKLAGRLMKTERRYRYGTKYQN